MIVVETSTSASPRRNESMCSSSSRSLHLAVADDEAEPGHELAQPVGRLVDRLDAVVEVERLAPAGDLALERGLDELLVVLADVRPDRAAALGRRLDHGDVAQPGERHVQRARDRRGRQREHVHLEPQRAEELLLRDAEALLLVDDDEPELLRDHVPGEDAVRPDQHVDLARGEVGEHLLHLRRLAEARDHLDPDGEVRGSARGTCSSAAGRGPSSARASASACRSARRRRRRAPRPRSCRSRRRRRRGGPSGAAPRGPPSRPRSRARWSGVSWYGNDASRRSSQSWERS